MKWYHYLAAFFAGMFIANAAPHFVNGISGNPFPTPFADPTGKGLSAPVINVIWALFNLVIGYLLFRYGKISQQNKLSLVVFFLGVLAVSILLSIVFLDKVKM